MSNPSKEVMRRSVEGHLTDLERMMEFDRGYQAGKTAMSAEYNMLCQSCKNGDNCKAGASESVESSKYAGNCKSGHSRTCPESDEEVSESAPSASITDELRRWANTEVPYKYGHQLHAIADRIDEQFDRICWQQEAVLQSTIDGMMDDLQSTIEHYESELRDTIERMTEENLTVKDERDHWKQVADMNAEADTLQAMNAGLTAKLISARESHMELKSALMSKNAECLHWYDKYLVEFDKYDDMKYERDNLLDLLKDARDEYKMLDRMSAETSANFHAMRDRVWGLEAERDELQAKLNEIAEVLDGRD